jgi:2-amino-4-hydroxy-6-hydroxymethyldihydropteridine diphosphokinase
MSHITFLALGSNLGDRIANLQKAIAALPPKFIPLVQSSVYETEPWGYSEQPAFLNLVLKGETDLAPNDLLSFLKQLEVSLGRRKTFRYGPRFIDLDILFYDNLVLDDPELVIPHPRIAERAFVLVPLAEIAPEFYHPTLGKTVQQLKSGVETSGIKLFLSAFV